MFENRRLNRGDTSWHTQCLERPVQTALRNEACLAEGRLNAVKAKRTLRGRRDSLRTILTSSLGAVALLVSRSSFAQSEELLNGSVTSGWLDMSGTVTEPVRTASGHFSFTVSLKLVSADTEETPVQSSNRYHLKEGETFARYLDRGANGERKFLFGLVRCSGEETSVGFGNVQAGYGPLLADDTVVTRGSNGTAWEEPSSIFVKTCFRF